MRRLAERGHDVHVAAQRVDIRSPLPPTLHLHVLMPASDTSMLDRLAFMVRMRLLFQRLSRRIAFDLVHQMNPVFTGLEPVADRRAAAAGARHVRAAVAQRRRRPGQPRRRG